MVICPKYVKLNKKTPLLETKEGFFKVILMLLSFSQICMVLATWSIASMYGSQTKNICKLHDQYFLRHWVFPEQPTNSTKGT